jgi:hypothetical protein
LQPRGNSDSLRVQAEAAQLLQQAITLYQTIGDRYSVPAPIGNYGWALRRASHHDDACPYFLRADDLSAAVGLTTTSSQNG